MGGENIRPPDMAPRNSDDQTASPFWWSASVSNQSEQAETPANTRHVGVASDPVVVVDDRDADQNVARPILNRQAQTRRNKYRGAA